MEGFAIRTDENGKLLMLSSRFSRLGLLQFIYPHPAARLTGNSP